MSNRLPINDTVTRCKAITRSGTACKNFSMPGTSYCYIHQSLSSTTQPTADSSSIDSQLFNDLSTQIKELRKRTGNVNTPRKTPFFDPKQFFEKFKDRDLDHDAKNGSASAIEIISKLRNTISQDFFDPDTWKGIWYMVNYSIEYQSDMIKRRFTGEYDTDEWGLDWEVLNTVRPFFEFLYRNYWRVDATGIDNIPESGRALLVSNHSGALPWDGAMIATAVSMEHSSQRLVRNLYEPWVAAMPFFSEFFMKCGQALASEENANLLLNQEELVAVYPEGFKGASKLYKNRYRLAPFNYLGFIKSAIKTQTPIIPVAVVGAEETYYSLADSKSLARLFGTPYFPVTPTWPWLGLIGLIPLPTKWYINFGQPLNLNSLETGSENNLILVSKINEQIRLSIQKMLSDRLSQRRSVLMG